MSALLNLDQQTMFTINALLLVVFAIAFAFAGLGQKDRTYWFYMVSSNVVFAIAFAIFSYQIDGTANGVFLPNLLLFIGLGFRLIAIRAFFGHSTPLISVLIIPIQATLAFMLWPFIGNSLTFGVINLLITVQLVTIIWTISVDQEDLKSKWGLILAYAVVVLSSFLRVLQGWVFDSSMSSLLPADVFLELNLIAAAIHISASGAFSLSIAYERSLNNLREIALRDPLTGLLNRWSIETLSEVLPKKKDSNLVCVIMIDIDHFKLINDAHGHATGDAVLKHCAELLKYTFRDYNLIARVGGEEFMILIPGKVAHSTAPLCEKFRMKLTERPFIRDGATVPFTVSIGICSGYVKERTEFDTIWENADKALYRAKSVGRNTTEIFEKIAAPTGL
ncbi:GGDEF domain-containing protein [Brucella rhizosphaerae]|uniref:diguanylate cyclase n=1 Tax=Brucella rhizosphaerae TaxID=571254 RepID=A0A256FBI4_9HYPH|nr:GGDEF domain-containing protein [Brucella rhizosphaerae]OYR12133.1 diguanylate cyclase domain protein [Brucella rhizosphaerae]